MREPIARTQIARRAGALCFAVLLGCLYSAGQTLPSSTGLPSSQPAKKAAPAFTASGIQGNIAPSGYSAGAREEETRQVASLVVDLQNATVTDELPADARLSCDQQAELLHAVLTHPDSFEANLRLGLFYLQHRNPALSMKYLGLARDKHPGDAALAGELATAEVEANDFAASTPLVEELIHANPSNALAHRLKGSIEAAAGHAQAALAEYELSATLDPEVNNLFSAGISIMALGLFADADRMFANATEAHPETAKLWLGRGMVEILQGHDPQAVDSLLRSATLDPTDDLAPTLLANSAGDAQASARILTMAQAFVAAKPREAVAHYDYALVLLKVEPRGPGAKVDERIESELAVAVREQPQFAAAHFELGIVHENAGDVTSAIAEFSQAVHLEPEVADWRYRLARAYRRAGQIPAAESEMERFLQLKAKRDAGGDVSAKLLDGLPPDLLGVASARCETGSAQPPP